MFNLLPDAAADAGPADARPGPVTVQSMMRSNSFGSTGAIGRRRHGLARLCQLGVAGLVERIRAAYLLVQALKSPAGTDLATNRISAKPAPLKFAEKPGYSPGLSASRLRCVIMPPIV